MAREGNTTGALESPGLYDQSDAARLSELDPDVVAYCVSHNLVKPTLREGTAWFSTSDILKLKLLRTLLLSRKLSAALDQAFLQIGRELLDERPGAAPPDNELADIVKQLLGRFQK